MAECWETERAWHDGESAQRRLQGTKSGHFLGLGMGGGSRIGDELPSSRDPLEGTVQLESVGAEQGAGRGQKKVMGEGAVTNSLPPGLPGRPPSAPPFRRQVQSWRRLPAPTHHRCSFRSPATRPAATVSPLPTPSSRGARANTCPSPA